MYSKAHSTKCFKIEIYKQEKHFLINVSQLCFISNNFTILMEPTFIPNMNKLQEVKPMGTYLITTILFIYEFYVNIFICSDFKMIYVIFQVTSKVVKKRKRRHHPPS